MMDSSNGWIIHHYPISDHLVLVYVLTPTRYFKAFYRIPKKQPYLKPQPFCPYWISWKESSKAINIQSIECRGVPFWFKDLKLFVSLYLNELVFNLCRPDTLEAIQFYSHYEKLLHHPEDCPELLLRDFEWQLLADSGYAIDFSCTASQEAIMPNLFYRFDPEQGFIQAIDGWLGKHLIALSKHQINEDNFKIYKKVVRQTILYLMDGKILHSRQLLTQWLRAKET